MISSFWNLCRACPSMPVEKLHSEYRSTFQWHEYVGSQSGNSVTQPPVIRQPSQAQQEHLSILTGRPEEPSFARRKKHPELANRSSNGWLTKSSTTYEASLCPESRFTNISGATAVAAAGGGGRVGGITSTTGPRKSISLGTIQASGSIATIHSPKLSLKPEDSEGGAVGIRGTRTTTTIAATDNVVPPMTSSVPEAMMSAFTDSRGGDEAGGGGGGGTYGAAYMLSQSTELKIHVARDMEQPQPASQQKPAEEFKKKEYKSEYKKRFRPFSQYEYVDGRFFKKKGDHEIGGDPWYKEVIELRKKAGEYKFRGWGTELGPYCSENIAEVYHQHVWDQVSRRTSLAALALITTTPKSISKEEKDKENAKKSYPSRPTHARPHTATPKHPISDLEKSKHPDTVQQSKKKWENRSTSRVKARSHSAGPAGRSPRKAIRQQSAASSVSEKDNTPLGGWKVHLDSAQGDKAPKPQQRHPRPTTLATSPRPKASSGKGDRDPKQLAKQQQFDKNSADPYLGYNEPVVKSPPEPTRVKSPEQVILRSPDPVNWTVPLDTTKSFTVTQNIREAPPSPRFRAGEKLHGANIYHGASTHHSSAASTMASSPISSFSTRSAPVPLSSTTTTTAATGQSGVPSKPEATTTTASSSIAPSSTSSSSTTTPAKTLTTTATSTTTTTTTTASTTAPQQTGGKSTGLEQGNKSSALASSFGSGGGGGGGGGSGKPDNAGAGPGTVVGGGSSSVTTSATASIPSTTSASSTSSTASSKPSQALDHKVVHHPAARSQSTPRNAVNGLDERASRKSLHKDKPSVSSPPVKSSPQLHRAGLKSASSSRPTSVPPSTDKGKGSPASSHQQQQESLKSSSKTTISSATTGLKCLDDPTFAFDPPSSVVGKPSVTATSKGDTSKSSTSKGLTDSSKVASSKPVTEQPKSMGKPEQSNKTSTSVGSKGQLPGETKQSRPDVHKTGVRANATAAADSLKSSTKAQDVSKTSTSSGKSILSKSHEPVKSSVTKSDVKTSVSSANITAGKTEMPKSKPSEPTKISSTLSSKSSDQGVKTAAAAAGATVTKTAIDSSKSGAPPSNVIDSNKLASTNKSTGESGKAGATLSSKPPESSKLPEPLKPISKMPTDVVKSTTSTTSTVSPPKSTTNHSVRENNKSSNIDSSSKIPEMKKSSTAESSKIPEMTKSMLAESSNKIQDYKGTSGSNSSSVGSVGGSASKIPEPVKPTVESNNSKIPEMKPTSIMTESSKVPEMSKSVLGEYGKASSEKGLGQGGVEWAMCGKQVGVGAQSKMSEVTKTSVGDASKMSEMTRSTIMGDSKIPASVKGESKLPEMTRYSSSSSVQGESKFPAESKIRELTRSTLTDSKQQAATAAPSSDMTKSIYVESSKIPEMTKSSLLGESKSSDMTRSIYGEPSRIPQMLSTSTARTPEYSNNSSGLPESSKIPEMTKSMLADSNNKNILDQSSYKSPVEQHLNKSPDLARSVYMASSPTPTSKLPEPMKSTFDSSKIPEPMKPTFDMSKIPEPSRPSDTSKLGGGNGLPSAASKIPEPSKALPPQGPPPPVPARTTEPPKSGIPAPSSATKIHEPMRISSASPLSKIPGYPGASSTTTTGASALASAIPGKTDPTLMSSSVKSAGFQSGIRLPAATTSERPSSAKGSLRVLEAPSSPPSCDAATGDSSSSSSASASKRTDFGFVPPAPVSIPKRTIPGGISSYVSETPPTGSQAKAAAGYRVLEAPDDPTEPTVSIISPSSSRSRASDVLEKARHRFDKFWGKGKDDEK